MKKPMNAKRRLKRAEPPKARNEVEEMLIISGKGAGFSFGNAKARKNKKACRGRVEY